MKWKADQRNGYFGYAPAGDGPWQFLHKARVDINAALAATGELMDLWLDTQKQPNAPAFSGGVLDAWPAYAVDALAIARDEYSLIRAFLMQEAERRG